MSTPVKVRKTRSDKGTKRTSKVPAGMPGGAPPNAAQITNAVTQALSNLQITPASSPVPSATKSKRGAAGRAANAERYAPQEFSLHSGRAAEVVRVGNVSKGTNSIVQFTSVNAHKRDPSHSIQAKLPGPHDPKTGKAKNYKVHVEKIAVITKKTPAEIAAEEHGAVILKNAWSVVRRDFPNLSKKDQTAKVREFLHGYKGHEAFKLQK